MRPSGVWGGVLTCPSTLFTGSMLGSVGALPGIKEGGGFGARPGTASGQHGIGPQREGAPQSLPAFVNAGGDRVFYAARWGPTARAQTSRPCSAVARGASPGGGARRVLK